MYHHKKSSADSPIPDVIHAQARKWFVCMLGTPTAEERNAFHAWRAANPLHGEAYSRIGASWDAARQPAALLAQQEANVLAGYLHKMARPAQKQWRFGVIGTLAAIVVMCFISVYLWLEVPHALQDWQADYVTACAERQTMVLPDGSIAYLDADSALAHVDDANRRHVKLLRGSAYFDVVKSPDIPFTVEVSGGAVNVLGTRFDVQKLDDGAIVTLERGSVSVTVPGQAHEAFLTPGQQLTFSSAGMDAIEKVNVAESMSWRHGRYVFYRARLGDVINQIARYRHGKIVIASSALKDARVTGSFSLENTDEALLSLQSSIGFQQSNFGQWLTVIR